MPSLDPATLHKHLDARRLGPLYLLVGDDARAVDRMLDAFEATVDPADRPFAVERIYAGESGGSPVDIAATARLFPMLGDRRIVIVMRAERLLKPKRAVRVGEAPESDESAAEDEGPADLAALEDYLEAPSPSTALVFVATDVDRTRRFTKRLAAVAQVADFGVPGGQRGEARDAGKRLIQEELDRAGRAIDPAARELLLDRTGSDLARLRADVERVLLYTEGQKRVTYDDAAEVASSEVAVEDPWGVVNAMADGDAARALREVGHRLDRGESPHMLVGQIRWWVSTRVAESDTARVRPALEALLRTDLALKSSGGDERVLVERLIVELTGKPLPSRGWRR